MSTSMVAKDVDEPRILRSYRRARTYPKTIRKLANLDLPYPVTIAQLAVWVGGFVVLWYARPLWTPIVGSLQVLVLVGIPTCAAVLLRHLRLEGRSPVAMAVGLAALCRAPRTGTIHARSARVARPALYSGLLILDADPMRPTNDARSADEDGEAGR